MKLANFKLLTIICEPVLRASVLDLAREHGATGFTATEVTGEGNGEKGTGEDREIKSKIEIVADQALASRLMEALAAQFFKDYSVITYLADISVMRAEKFEK